jgi:hypothetical protein
MRGDTMRPKVAKEIPPHLPLAADAPQRLDEQAGAAGGGRHAGRCTVAARRGRAKVIPTAPCKIKRRCVRNTRMIDVIPVNHRGHSSAQEAPEGGAIADAVQRSIPMSRELGNPVAVSMSQKGRKWQLIDAVDPRGADPTPTSIRRSIDMAREAYPQVPRGARHKLTTIPRG